MKAYSINLDGKEYRVNAVHEEDGYTYLVDIETGEDVHSLPTRDWRG